jgi:hypothetical protein
MNPTVAQLREFADRVEMFDPEKWREHRNPEPPTPETETFKEKVPDFVAIIKNEESYKNDLILHDLPDEELIFLWALRNLKKTNCLIMLPYVYFFSSTAHLLMML